MRSFHLMGVVNVTPDSFSDGGSYFAPRLAIDHGVQLAAEGAQVVDVGGESTRPGARPVSEAEELRRVMPVIEGLAEAFAGQRAAGPAPAGAARISIDTCKAAVARAALAGGAAMVNDVSALRADPEMAETIAAAGVDCCLMHMQGRPETMQAAPEYGDVLSEVKAFLDERLHAAVAAGIDEERILLDPGIGFGKSLEHNLTLIERVDELLDLGRPILIGTSRKSFIGTLAGRWHGDGEAGQPPADRLPGTIASNLLAFERGVSWFRVHDVRPVGEALALAAATLASNE